MNKYILTYLFTLVHVVGFAQYNETWFSFWNKDTTLRGYKTKNGIIKIEPKFTSPTSAERFDDIIAAAEEVHGAWESYYLTKRGRIIGRDSLHFFDNGVDCESEGFIRFRDKKSDKVGMFNRNGDIVIAAEYNDLERVRNGLVIALKGAKKIQHGEHYGWKGGKELLLDTNNKVLIDSFTYDFNLNLYSVLISAKPVEDTIRENFKSTDGRYYAFINTDKEFQAWLKSSLLSNFTKETVLKCSHKEISFWKEETGWTSEAKGSFMDRNFDLLREKLLPLRSPNCDYHIFTEALNPYTFDPDEYKDYFNNCGEPKDWIYPVKNIVINYKDNNKLLQDHFEFLRTSEGYKLISVSIRKGELR